MDERKRVITMQNNNTLKRTSTISPMSQIQLVANQSWYSPVMKVKERLIDSHKKAMDAKMSMIESDMKDLLDAQEIQEDKMMMVGQLQEDVKELKEDFKVVLTLLREIQDSMQSQQQSQPQQQHQLHLLSHPQQHT
jgi:hypothetical protein